MKRALLVGMGLVLVGGVVTPAATSTGGDSALAASRVAMPFDFDGDGFADMAVGVPGEALGSTREAGAVQVLYGSTSGVTDHDQFWHEGSAGVKGKVENSDRFGQVVDSGDFDRDGYADLAIGVPEENVGKPNAGKVQVLYGSPTGLTASGDQVWHQGKKGVPGTNEKTDWFGKSLAVGDFDGDGYADLAVGVPREEVGGKNGAGRVVVLRGSASGLTASGVQSWTENSPGVATKAWTSDYFGEDLAAGDVSGDGRDDLAISARYDTGRFEGSAVHLLVGSPSGLTATNSQFLRLTSVGLTADGTSVDSLRLGDVNADGHADLTIGSEYPDPVVVLLHGHADGFHPGPLPAPGQPGSDTIWSGYIKAVSGDVTGDGYADLALAGRQPFAGPPTAWVAKFAIVVGTSKGLGERIPWPKQAVRALNILPLSGSTHSWLLLGNKYDVSEEFYAGAVTVVQATKTGAPGPATVWTQDEPRIKNRAENRDYFGRTVGGA
jgi:hypothetical protein